MAQESHFQVYLLTLVQRLLLLAATPIRPSCYLNAAANLLFTTTASLHLTYLHGVRIVS